MPKTRIDSVDALRAICLVGMIICHFPIYLSSGDGSDSLLYTAANHLLGGDFGAALFVFLVGFCQNLSSKKRCTAGSKSLLRAIYRGMFIFILGLLFLYLVQGPKEVWNWDILTFIGASTIVLVLFRNVSTKWIIFTCVLILGITPWIRSFVDLLPFYGNFESVKGLSEYLPNFIIDPVREYQGINDLKSNLLGFTLIGQFPLLPWIVYPLIGFIVGRRVTSDKFASDEPYLLIIGPLLIIMGLMLAYAGSIRSQISVANDYIVPISFYPLSFSLSLMCVGVVLLVYLLFWKIFDQNMTTEEPSVFLKYFRQLSKYSMTVYVTHFMIIFYPLRLTYFFTGNYYLRDAMSTTLALICSLSLALAYYPLLKLWDRANGKFSFEWFLAQTLTKKR